MQSYKPFSITNYGEKKYFVTLKYSMWGLNQVKT